MGLGVFDPINQMIITIVNTLNRFCLSNGHSPQICQNGKLLVRMCRGESHFSQKSPLANVGESGESRQSRLANVDECIESDQNRLANVDECIESDQNRLANFGESGEYLPSLGKCWPMIR